ncbi:MAG: DUF922 domain-containing protein [Gammaproteobacteria bacterium]
MANTITGRDYQLKWQDFAGPVPANRGSSVAFTSASYTLNYSVAQAYAAIGIRVPDAQNNLGYVVTNLRIAVAPNRPRMWSVQSARTNDLLKHEQGHYDIVALIADELFNDLLSPPSVMTTAAAVQSFVNIRKAAADRLMDALQSNATRDGLYDTSTNHGLTTAQQTRWNRAFANSRPPLGMRFSLALDAEGIRVP